MKIHHLNLTWILILVNLIFVLPLLIAYLLPVLLAFFR